MEPNEHAELNRKIQTLARQMESEAAPLRHTKDHIFGANVQPENLFEVHAGDFWSMFETRNYMRAHLALADEIHDKIAVVYDTKAAWEVVVWHYQEMLRLCSGDSLGLRYRFPFLLMQPNRDDDAFCFLRYWMQGDENYVSKRELHKKSTPGDWIYGHEKDARYADIFNVCPNVKCEYVCLALLVALACIKMRTIDESPDRKVELGKQLDRLLHLIKERNPTMLPALLNPTPLTSQPKPEYMTQGSPAECYTIVEDASGIWSDIPGAVEWLQEQFGVLAHSE